MKVTFCCANYQ